MEPWLLAGSHPSNNKSGIDPQITYHGKNCAYLKCIVEEPEGFATVPRRINLPVCHFR